MRPYLGKAGLMKIAWSRFLSQRIWKCWNALANILNAFESVGNVLQRNYEMFSIVSKSFQNIRKTFSNVENALNGTSLIRCNGKHSPNVLTLSTTELQKLQTVRHLLAPSFDNLDPRS